MKMHELRRSEYFRSIFESVDFGRKALTTNGVLVLCNDINEISESVLSQNPEILKFENARRVVLEKRVKRKGFSYYAVSKMYNEYLAKDSSWYRKNHKEFANHMNLYADSLRFHNVKENSYRYILNVREKESTIQKRGMSDLLILVLPNFDLSKFRYEDKTELSKKTYYKSIFDNIYYEIPESKKAA